MKMNKKFRNFVAGAVISFALAGCAGSENPVKPYSPVDTTEHSGLVECVNKDGSVIVSETFGNNRKTLHVYNLEGANPGDSVIFQFDPRGFYSPNHGVQPIGDADTNYRVIKN